MKKIFVAFTVLTFISFKTFSQEKELPVLYQKDSAVPMRGEHMTHVKIQKQKAKDKSKQNNLLHTPAKNKIKLKPSQIHKTDKLETIITPAEKEKLKEKKNNTPRRGVTNMPNERTAK